MPWWGEFLVALTLLISVVGTIIPVLPGALLAAAAIGIWAWVEGGQGAWAVAIACGVILIVGQVLKYVVPARTLSNAQVPWRAIALGTVAGIVGFFVVPVVGLPIGFVLGVWVYAVISSGTVAGSWTTTWASLKAIGVSTLVEAASVYFATVAWLAGTIAINAV